MRSEGPEDQQEGCFGRTRVETRKRHREERQDLSRRGTIDSPGRGVEKVQRRFLCKTLAGCILILVREEGTTERDQKSKEVS